MPKSFDPPADDASRKAAERIDARAERDKIAAQSGPVVIPDPEGLPKPEHGAQVRLTGVARAAARGAAHTSLEGNAAVMAAVVGGVPDGGASPEHQRKLDPEDGSELEERIRVRGEQKGVKPQGEDDEATAAKTAPAPIRDALQTEATVTPTPPKPAKS